MGTKRVELDMIGFNVSNNPVEQGKLALRWRKLVYDDAGQLLGHSYHRTELDVDTEENVDAALAAIYDDLEHQGFGRPPETDRGYIDDMIARAWTPEVRKAVKLNRDETKKRVNKELEAEKAAAEQRNTEEEARIESIVDRLIAKKKK